MIIAKTIASVEMGHCATVKAASVVVPRVGPANCEYIYHPLLYDQ